MDGYAIQAFLDMSGRSLRVHSSHPEQALLVMRPSQEFLAASPGPDLHVAYILNRHYDAVMDGHGDL